MGRHPNKISSVKLMMSISPDMREHCMAISYHRGNGGQYSTEMKRLTQEAINRYLAGLSEKEKAAFNEILANVRLMISMGVHRQGRSLRLGARLPKIPTMEKKRMKI